MAAIELPEGRQHSEAAAGQPAPGNHAALKAVAVVVAGGAQALRREHQVLLLAERKKVGALPHIALAGFRPRQHPVKPPVAQAAAAIEQHLSAVVAIAGADDHPPLAVLAPDFRIAKVHDPLRGQQHRALLFEVNAVPAGGQALHFADRAVVALAVEPDVAGVDKRQHAVVVHRATGEAAVAIFFAARRQRNRPVLPVDHIVAGGVAPVHWAPVGAVGVVLIESVVLAAEPDETVWIVHPARRRRQVVAGIKCAAAAGAHRLHSGLRAL